MSPSVSTTPSAAPLDFEAMLADLVRADVVFVGEQHDDPNTHRLEQAMLDGLRRRRATVTVSFEMFERDVQNVVDRYLSGAITEAQFLQEARPWPRYATDYRALVELAKKEGWAVIAANVPRRLASEVAKSGQSALDRLTPEDRALIAREFQCLQDAYFERFAKAMTGHSPGTAATADQRATTDRALLVAVHERRDDGGIDRRRGFAPRRKRRPRRPFHRRVS